MSVWGVIRKTEDTMSVRKVQVYTTWEGLEAKEILASPTVLRLCI